MQKPPRVSYVSSSSARKAADLLPSNVGRASLVHSLIEALDLLREAYPDDGKEEDTFLNTRQRLADPVQANKATVVETVTATRRDLLRFHDADFIEALLREVPPENDVQPSIKRRRLNESTRYDGKGVETDSFEEGDITSLEHDCPTFEGIQEYCYQVAGGSLTAARELRDGRADTAIHWDGGRHHATKDKAAGFCYINDIVLAILELQKASIAPKYPGQETASKRPARLKKILYIDLDLHHGDGVAEAFENNPNVTTLSMHLWSRGFYPSTPQGHLRYTGPPAPSPPSYTSLNLAVPHSGLSDTTLLRFVKSCIKPVFEALQPAALVLQCGLDGLAGDPCKEWNLPLEGYGEAVKEILSWTESSEAGVTDGNTASESPARSRLPVLMLGGGGYHSTNAARGWAYLTSIALGRPYSLSEASVPEYCSHWETFARSDGGEGLDVPANKGRKDENIEKDIEEIEECFRVYAEKIAEKSHV